MCDLFWSWVVGLPEEQREKQRIKKKKKTNSTQQDPNAGV